VIKAPTTQKEARNVVIHFRLTQTENNALKHVIAQTEKKRSKLLREALTYYLSVN
jgi:hypothetical protein